MYSTARKSHGLSGGDGVRSFIFGASISSRASVINPRRALRAAFHLWKRASMIPVNDAADRTALFALRVMMGIVEQVDIKDVW